MLRAFQKRSWSVLFESISCACSEWGCTLRCQSFLLKERMVPRIRACWIDLGCLKTFVLAHSSTKPILILSYSYHFILPCLVWETCFSEKYLCCWKHPSWVNKATHRQPTWSITFCHKWYRHFLWFISCLYRQILLGEICKAKFETFHSYSND